jgi:hypothetical protein
MRRRILASVIGACLLTACVMPQPPAATPPAATEVAQAAASPEIETNRVTVEGIVRVPSSLVAAGGMNLVAAGGMNLVAAGGMNLVAAGGMNLVAAGGMNLTNSGGGGLVAAGGMNHKVLLATTEQPLGGVVVFLCDGLGRIIPGLPPVATNADGSFAVPHVPAGFTLVVNALVPFQDGRRGLLAALVRTGIPGAVEVDAATTIAAIRAAGAREDGALGEFEANQFKLAVADIRTALTDPTTPDYRDQKAVGTKAAEVEAKVPGLGDKLSGLRADLLRGPTSPVGPAGPGAAPLPPPRGGVTGAGTVAATPKPEDTSGDVKCGETRIRTFQMRTLGARLIFRTRVITEDNRLNWPIRANTSIEGNTSKPVAIPEGCPFRVELLSADGRELASEDAYTILPGAQDPIVLPF